MRITNRDINKLNFLIGIMILIFVSFFSLLTSSWILIGNIFAFVFFFKYSGIEFDFENRKYRKYDSLFYFTKGIWKNIGQDVNLVILYKSGNKKVLGTLGVGELSVKMKFCELYLMDQHHLNRVLIDSSTNKIKINDLAEKISKLSHVEIKTYSPNTYK